MNAETGDMLEYRHLVKNPKYREVYGRRNSAHPGPGQNGASSGLSSSTGGGLPRGGMSGSVMDMTCPG